MSFFTLAWTFFYFFIWKINRISFFERSVSLDIQEWFFRWLNIMQLVSTRHEFTICESRFQKFLVCFVIFSISMRPDCARGRARFSKFHNFRINDPAILIQSSSYFITDFKESKSTKKKIRKESNLEKNDFAFISLLLYVKKYWNNFFATISVKKSRNKQKNACLFIVDKEPKKNYLVQICDIDCQSNMEWPIYNKKYNIINKFNVRNI